MNERIKELRKQAWDYAMAVFDGHIVPPLDKEVWPIENVLDEKFAELIVRECAAIANKQFTAATGLDDRDSWTAAEIKQHFGVEEC